MDLDDLRRRCLQQPAAVEDHLRESYAGVAPGCHLDKRHWNTVTLDGSVADAEVAAWIEDSWDLVVAGLPKRVQVGLRSR